MGTTPPCLPAFCLWNTNSRDAAVFINTHETVLNMLNAVFILQFNVTQLWSNAFLLLFILVPLSRFGVLRGAAEDQDPVSGRLSLFGIASILQCLAGKHPPIPAPLRPFRIILEGRWGWSCPGGSVVKNLPGMPKMQETGSISGSGRPPGGGHGNPLKYSCLERPIDRGALQAIVHRVAKRWTRLM